MISPGARPRYAFLRRLFLIVLCSVLAAVNHATAAEPVPSRIRVLTYNIHHAEGVDGQLDLDRIARVISDCRPDLVALQEVDQKTSRTDRVDQPAELAKKTGLQVVFGSNLEFGGGHYGNAVLSRWPIRSSKNHALPNTGGGEQRGVLDVVIAPAAAKWSIRLLATHLDHRRPDAQRLQSAAVINRMVSKDGTHELTLLAGDLNAVPGSATLRTFESVWQRANQDVLPTIPVTQPTRQIDFVLFQPTASWRVGNVRVLTEAVASDHRGVLAEFVHRRPHKAD